MGVGISVGTDVRVLVGLRVRVIVGVIVAVGAGVKLEVGEGGTKPVLVTVGVGVILGSIDSVAVNCGEGVKDGGGRLAVGEAVGMDGRRRTAIKPTQ